MSEGKILFKEMSGGGNREHWIDALKGIGIILVVIGHVSLGNNLVKWIYSFHMPLFFALSGYMLAHTQRNYSNYEFILKRTKCPPDK